MQQTLFRTKKTSFNRGIHRRQKHRDYNYFTVYYIHQRIHSNRAHGLTPLVMNSTQKSIFWQNRLGFSVLTSGSLYFLLSKQSQTIAVQPRNPHILAPQSFQKQLSSRQMNRSSNLTLFPSRLVGPQSVLVFTPISLQIKLPESLGHNQCPSYSKTLILQFCVFVVVENTPTPWLGSHVRLWHVSCWCVFLLQNETSFTSLEFCFFDIFDHMKMNKNWTKKVTNCYFLIKKTIFGALVFSLASILIKKGALFALLTVLFYQQLVPLAAFLIK